MNRPALSTRVQKITVLVRSSAVLLVIVSATDYGGVSAAENRQAEQQPSHPAEERFSLSINTPDEDINQGAKIALEALRRSAIDKAGITVPSANEPDGHYAGWIHPYDNYWMNHVTPYFYPRESVEWPIRLFAAYQVPSDEISGGVYSVPEDNWRQRWIDAGGLKAWQYKVMMPLGEWIAQTQAGTWTGGPVTYTRDHLFVLQVFDQWQSSGSKSFLMEMYGACRRSLKYLERERDTNKNGLIETAAILSDLVVNGDTDPFSTERAEDQVMLYGALLAFERMAVEVGGAADAEWAKGWAARVKELTNKTFWHPDGRYIFGVDRKTREPKLGYVTTTYANGYAILFGLADPQQTTAILDFMARQQFQVPGPYHIPPIRKEDHPQNEPGVYCNGGCGWGRGIMPSITLACFQNRRIEQGLDYLQRQAAAARKAGSFHEYWTWEKYQGDSRPGGASWYCETSAGFLDALLHGLFGMSSPLPGFHQVRFTPKLPRDWPKGALSIRVPSGSRVTVEFTRDQNYPDVHVNSNPPLPIEVVFDRPQGKSFQLQGEGFKQPQGLEDKQSKQVTLLFSTGTGRATVRSVEN